MPLLLLMAEAPQGCGGLQELLGGVSSRAINLGSCVLIRGGLIRLKSSQVPTAALTGLAMAGLYPPGPAGRGGASVGAGWDSDLHHGRIHFGNDYLRLEDVWPEGVEGISQQLQSTNLMNIHLSTSASIFYEITTEMRPRTSFLRGVSVGRFSS